MQILTESARIGGPKAAKISGEFVESTKQETAVIISRFVDGKIAEAEFDALSFLQQPGLVPELQ